MDPSTGPAAGGTRITLTGTGFLPPIDGVRAAPVVRLGWVPFGDPGELCTDLTVDDSTHLSCSTPAHVAGIARVAVWANIQGPVGAPDFTYVEPTPSPSPSPVPVPVPTPTPQPTPGPAPDPVPTELPPGDGSAVVDGAPVPVTVAPDPGGTAVTVSGGGVSLTVEAADAGGTPLPLAPDGSLLVPADGAIPMSGSGLAAGSEVSMYLFSDPTSLGTVTATAGGTYATSATIPAGVPAGSHTIQVAATNSSGKAINLSLGITVTASATITLDAGERIGAGRHDRITATGTVTGIAAGATLTPYIHYAGQSGFTPGRGTITVAPDGTFTWTRNVGHNRRIAAYVAYTDTRSNTVIWRKVR